MPTVIGTTNYLAPAPTREFNGRRVDRNQDGTLWAAYAPSNGAGTPTSFFYSKDNGATWTKSASDIDTGGHNPASLFIDLDDFAHFVWKQGSTSSGRTAGKIYYMRGTPNAARTAWTWSAHLLLHNTGSTSIDFPDVVACRTPGASTWDAFIVCSEATTAPSNYALYSRVRIGSDGALSTPVGDGLSETGSTGSRLFSLGPATASGHGVNAHTFPSIDLHHTGDGKTVAGGTPHLYVGWTAGAVAAGKGVRFRSARYSAGAWTWNAEREIDAAGAVTSVPTFWQVLHFDGTRAVITGQLSGGGAGGAGVVIYDRDAGDTTTTKRVLLGSIGSNTGLSNPEQLIAGSATYNHAGDVYLFGRDGSGANGTRLVNVRRWTRSGATLGAITTFDTTGQDAPAISAKRGHSASSLDWIWSDGPGNVTFERILLNRAPNTPTLTAPNGGETINTNATVSCTSGGDPDGDPLTFDYDLTTDGGTTWTRIITGGSTSQTYNFKDAPASTACRVRVRAVDPAGLTSAFDESDANFTISHNTAPTAPLLGKPENGSSADLAAGFTFTYTATDPDAGDAPSAWAFRRKVAGAAAYEYWNAGTAAWQSTLFWNTNPTGSVAFASGKWANGNTYNWSVATKDTAGLEGPFAADFSVTGTSAPTAAVTAPTGSITATSRPLVRWTLTQPEGQPQQTYQVRVFSAAQYGAAGFDPATSTATWGTAEITSAGAREHQVGVDLVNGTTYRAYVRLRAAGLYTAWALSEFTMALTPPPPASLRVADEPDSPLGPRVRLDASLTFSGTFTQANTTITVERSDDLGDTWTPVRRAERMPLSAAGAAVEFDYEPPRAVPVQYRAFSVASV